MKKLSLLGIVIILAMIINVANAQQQRRGIVVCTATPCTWQDFANSLINLIKTVVWFAFWVTVLLCTIGAFLIMFHGPKPDLYKKGVDMIKIAITGYILLLLSGVIFDIILEFFAPKFTTLIPAAFAQALTPTTYLDPFKNALTQGLKCGLGAKTALERVFNCLFEAIALLKNLALILLTIAIIGSAAYLITTPLFGLKNITKAYQILIWSVIGLIIILLADVIKSQIERLTK